MGLPLGPTFANIFMSFMETKWLDDCPTEFKPVYYRRYVDDTFLLFNDKSHVVKFQNYLNNKHSNIKFTYETEENQTLPFLDCLITKRNNKFDTSVFRKSTFSGLGMSFFSFIPFIYKINSIKTLIHRGYTVSSSYFRRHSEFNKLKHFFSKNGFPYRLVQSQINKYLSKVNSSDCNTINSQDSSQIRYITLPYFGQ